MATTLTSYDTGSKPFKPDISRGKWSSISDFYAATLSHSFGIKLFSILPMYAVSNGGILLIFPFLLGLLILCIPVYFIQSFMGQFSSSGFISAYRIAPLFKGAGYAILVMNLASICYSIAIASYTLVYFFDSFNPELPWMTCNNAWNSHNCTVIQKFDVNDTHEFEESWSSIEYFVNGVREVPLDEDSEVVVISWRLLLCIILIWTILVAIIIQGVEFIGQLLRYFCFIIMGCLAILFLRILFLKRSYHLFFDFFIPEIKTFAHYFELIIFDLIIPICLYGAGGGTILTIASYNNFHSDIRIYSWVNAFMLFNMFFITGMWTAIVEDYLSENYNFKFFYYDMAELHLPFIGIPFFFGKLEMSNFWSMTFFLMLFLGEMSGCIIQMLTIVTAIFDEYEFLRTYKKGITIVMSIILFLFSICFTTNEGTKLVQHLINASGISLCLICFLDIMIVVWFYGRERFQRDVQFLLQGKMYHTWEFMILRFVTPVLMLFVILLNVVVYITDLRYHKQVWDILTISVIVKGTPLFLILIWIIYKLKISTGNILVRFKRLCIPTDWYPIDPCDKRQYEDVIGASSENFQDLCTNIDIEDIDCD